MKISCRICEKEISNYSGLTRHIIYKHKIEAEEYYNKYIKTDNTEGICQFEGCSNKTKFVSISKGYLKYCSFECSCKCEKSKQKRKKTNIERYGGSSPSCSPEIIAKIEKTNIEKYGTPYPMQSNICKERVKKTCINKYGYDNVSKIPEIKNKLRRKRLSLSDKDKTKIIDKSRKTCINKYGYDNVSKIPEIKNKRKQTVIKKYGLEYSCLIPKCLKNSEKSIRKKHLDKLNKYMDIFEIEIVGKIKNSHSKSIFRCNKCSCIFQSCSDYIIHGYGLCPNCYKPSYISSNQENELFDFIQQYESNVIRNDRSILYNNKELDIVIPNKNIAIEYNGLYWHGDNILESKNYHIDKLNNCIERGYKLITIFEDEWLFKKDIVKSRLLSILGLIDNKIYARNCEVRNISPKIKDNFLQQFHIQGTDISKINLGLFYNNNLISVMTFSHGNISKGSRLQEKIWELDRFCSILNSSIIGGAGKLLSYFEKNYEWNKIFSYADRRWSVGDLYNRLGFRLEHITQPNYWYAKGNIRIHRFRLRKTHNEPKDIPEYILRSNEGYWRIWDCGNLKFVKERDLA